MKRSWLIGAALVLSLSAIGCSDDEGDDDDTPGDSSVPDAGGDAGPVRNDASVDAGGMDASTDAGNIDAGGDAARPDATTPDATTPTNDGGSSDASTTVDAAATIDAGDGG